MTPLSRTPCNSPPPKTTYDQFLEAYRSGITETELLCKVLGLSFMEVADFKQRMIGEAAEDH